ncbi:TPA: hypothetical protein DEP58_01625 [Patescibacteria group bacterium]|nr:hypothetical protein [Patescibacteria group bacterium]
MNNNFIALILSVGVFVLAGAVYFNQNQVNVVTEDGEKIVVGSQVSNEHLDRQFNKAGSTDGGRLATTTSVATYTTTARDFDGAPTYWDITPNLNTTLSLSSTSTFEYVPNIGDVAKVYVRNASSTAGATITLAAVDANLDLQKNEDTADLAINGLDWAELTIIRESGYLVTVIMSEFIEGD